MKTIPSSRLRPLALGTWLLAATALWAQSSDPWTLLQQENADSVVAAYVPRLRQRGFTAEQAGQTLACLANARRQGVPATALTLRLEEGLAKNVDPPSLLAALQARLGTMVQARSMVQAAHYDMTPGSPCDELLTATGLAAESGVPVEDLSAILQRGNGQSALRIQSVIEAGETLHLAGIDPATTRNLMNDCLDRGLRRMEVMRATRYAIQQHRGGMDGERIRQTLWGGNAAIEGAHGWRGGGGTGGMGPGPGGPGRPAAPGSGAGGGGGHGNGAGGPP
jgi:hypothetical protein